MKIVDCEQGTLLWRQIRLGVPSASRADSLITPKTRKPSGGRSRYRAELLAEWLLGQPLDAASSGFMERGKDLEDEARKYYEFQGDIEVEEVGFITRDDGKAGCSPDGLVLDGGLLEIKCPSALVHVGYMLGDSPDYIGQCQFQLYITGRSWVDVISYNPDLPPVIYRVKRDAGYIDLLVPVLDEFIEKLDAEKERLAEHKVIRPWDIARQIDEEIVTLRALVIQAEGVEAELLSFNDRETIEKAIELRNLEAIERWIEDLENLPWDKFAAHAEVVPRDTL